MPSLSSAARRARAAADAKKPPGGPDAQAGGLFANQISAAAANAQVQNLDQNRGQANAGGRALNPPGARENTSRDIPFEVRGFATDPKHSGYQILTNYESTYWRAFVGVPAWALYEVLRSFCHNGNNICYPSINYLLEVLGVKQRRVLTGWSTTVKDKEYHYPGLIEILQSGGLVIAEMVGEGPMQRYLFHVNLTPDLLRPEQVTELPALLQSKHSEMLQTHFAEMAELASRRRPAKGDARPGSAPEFAPEPPQDPYPPAQVAPPATIPNQAQPAGANSLLPRNNVQNDSDSTTLLVENGGMTNCQTGVTNCHTPSDKLSHKQHQLNITQLTDDPPTNLINNNSGGLQEELQIPAGSDSASINTTTDVVVALTNLGLADSVVERLTTRFKRERILEKIDFLAYLESYHPNKVKNPRGWLRRAIEENYGAPDGYVPAAQRAPQAPLMPDPSQPAPISYAAFENTDAVAASQAAQATAQAERLYQKSSRQELVRRLAAPTAETLAFWELVQRDVRSTMTADHYQLIADASILRMDDAGVGEGSAAEGHVVVAIWDRELYRQLLHPNRAKGINRTMSILTKRKLTLICEFWDEDGQVVPPGTPPP